MSLQINKPEITGHVLVSYSEERKKEMEKFKEDRCSALVSLLMGRMKEHGVTIEKVLLSHDKERFADIIIKFSATDETLRELTKSIDQLGNKDVGVGKISLFKTQ